MKRREILLGGLGGMITLPVRAEGGCGSMTPQGRRCRVNVQRPTIIRQRCPEWCWAASSAMIFAMHGHPIDQMKIVSAVFGAPACLPAGQSLTIAQVLSSNWMDDDGGDFQASVNAAYDLANDKFSLTIPLIIQELMNDQPLLYCNTHHAMVVAQVDFIDTPVGPIVDSVGVFDPWPWSQPFRTLTAREMQPAHEGGEMTFLAAVQVDG